MVTEEMENSYEGNASVMYAHAQFEISGASEEEQVEYMINTLTSIRGKFEEIGRGLADDLDALKAEFDATLTEKQAEFEAKCTTLNDELIACVQKLDKMAAEKKAEIDKTVVLKNLVRSISDNIQESLIVVHNIGNAEVVTVDSDDAASVDNIETAVLQDEEETLTMNEDARVDTSNDLSNVPHAETVVEMVSNGKENVDEVGSTGKENIRPQSTPINAKDATTQVNQESAEAPQPTVPQKSVLTEIVNEGNVIEPSTSQGAIPKKRESFHCIACEESFDSLQAMTIHMKDDHDMAISVKRESGKYVRMPKKRKIVVNETGSDDTGDEIVTPKGRRYVLVSPTPKKVKRTKSLYYIKQ